MSQTNGMMASSSAMNSGRLISTWWLTRVPVVLVPMTSMYSHTISPVSSLPPWVSVRWSRSPAASGRELLRSGLTGGRVGVSRIGH